MSAPAILRPRLLLPLLALTLILPTPTGLAAQEPAAPSTGQVEGIVRGDDGTLLEGVTVQIVGTDLGALSDEEGVFRIRGVPAGRQTLRAQGLGYGSVESSVLVSAGEVADVRIALSTRAVEVAGITVVGRRGFYDARAANSATRTTAPIINTPVSVQVVTPQVLEDLNAMELSEVYENVSGVFSSGSTLNASTVIQPHIRGFISDAFLRDGMRVSIAGSGGIDMAEVESVEILKGPASILYGAVQPGGILNYVTKKPLPASRYEVEMETGSYDLFRGRIDAGGPLGSPRLRYRLNASLTDAGSFRDFVETERTLVAPALAFDVSEDVEIGVRGSFSREQVPYDTGVQFSLEGEPLTDVSTFFGDPDLAPRDMEARYLVGTLDAALDERWSLRVSASTSWNETFHEAVRPLVVSVGDDGVGMVRRRFQTQRETTTESQLLADVLGTFEVGGTRHDLVVGFEARALEEEDRQFRQNLAPFALGQNPRDIVRPDVQFPEPSVGSTDWVAALVQDQIAFADDRVHVLLSGRLDMVEQVGDLTVDEPVTFEDEAFTGRVGILAKVGAGLAPFASVSQSFLPQRPGILDVDGNPLEPEEGFQVEGGVKYESADGRFSGTLAGYGIRKEGLAFFDFPTFVETGAVAWLPGVEHASRGVELDLAGEVAPGLNVLANYAWTDTEIVASPDEASVGDALGGVPEHASRLWASYQAPVGSSLDDLRVGAGIRYASSRGPSFDLEPLFEMDAYTLVDASVSYRLHEAGLPVRLQARVENLFDVEYFTRATSLVIVHPGAPRTLELGVSATF